MYRQKSYFINIDTVSKFAETIRSINTFPELSENVLFPIKLVVTHSNYKYHCMQYIFLNQFSVDSQSLRFDTRHVKN